MNRDRWEGAWRQFKGRLRETWGTVTGNPAKVMSGRRELLAGSLQEAYGIGKEKAESQCDDQSVAEEVARDHDAGADTACARRQFSSDAHRMSDARAATSGGVET